jgi:hypothetical protein
MAGQTAGPAACGPGQELPGPPRSPDRMSGPDRRWPRIPGGSYIFEYIVLTMRREPPPP